MPDGAYLVLDTKDVDAMFLDMQKRVRKNILARALKAAMNVIADAVRTDCADVTGILQASIRVRVSTSSDGLTGSAKLDFGDQNIIAARVEFGHVQFTHLPGHKEVGVVPPHPFIWNAVDRSLDAAMTVYTRMIESELVARG